MGFVSRSGRCSILMVFKNGGLRALESFRVCAAFFWCQGVACRRFRVRQRNGDSSSRPDKLGLTGRRKDVNRCMDWLSI